MTTLNPPSSFTQIPTIDLSQATGSASRAALLHDIRHALTQVGFLYVTGHGVPEATVAELVGLLPRLFSYSSAGKGNGEGGELEAVALERSPHFLGYSRLGAETTAGGTDWREQFEFANELEVGCAEEGRDGEGEGEGEVVPAWERLRGPNQWPPAVPGLLAEGEVRRVVGAYVDAMMDLAMRWLRLVEEALGLPGGVLDGFVGDQHRVKLVRYPPPPSSSQQTTQGVGPHKDSSGWWTFLLQATPGPAGRGLQVRNAAGAWVDVPPVEGTFVVNIGQAFEVVTRGQCRATVHRVVLDDHGEDGEDGEDRENARGERFSVPFFQGVRRSLTRREAVEGLRGYFDEDGQGGGDGKEELDVDVDSAWLRSGCETWGEWQLRTKIRSHRENGRAFYADVFERYTRDEE